MKMTILIQKQKSLENFLLKDLQKRMDLNILAMKNYCVKHKTQYAIFILELFSRNKFKERTISKLSFFKK